MTPPDRARRLYNARSIAIVFVILGCIPGYAAAQGSIALPHRFELIPYPDGNSVGIKYPLYEGTAPEFPVPGAPWSIAAHPDGRHACVGRLRGVARVDAPQST